MKNKKAFELSMSLIAVVIVVLVVLAIVIIFVSGSTGNLFGKLNVAQSTLTTDDIQTFQLGCKNACTQAKQMVSSENQWLNSKYCTLPLKGNIDRNSDGTIGGYDKDGKVLSGGKYNAAKTQEIGIDLHCWDPQIGVDCEVLKVLVADIPKTCNVNKAANSNAGACVCV